LKKNAEAQIENLDLLVKSRFVEMFGDVHINEKEWRTVALASLIVHANNGMSRRGNDDDGSIVLRIVELRDGYIDYKDPNRIILNEKEKKRYLLVDGDFLFVRVNGNPINVGRCAFFQDVGVPVYHNDHIIRVRFKEDLNSRYLSHLLNGRFGKDQIRRKIKTSAGQYTISQDGIGEIIIPLPPLSLQREFAAFVEKVEKLKDVAKKSVEEMDTLYRAKLQEYFG
jgi:type I restriction enzyme S subunit